MPQFDYTQVPDPSKIHPLVETCTDIDETLEHIVDVYEKGKNQIIKAYQRLQKEYTDQKLKSADLTQINHGINISSLESKGINTVYDLLQENSPEIYKSMPFSDSSALLTRAKILEQTWKDRFSIHLDPDSKDKDINTIVALATQLLAVQKECLEAKKLYDDIHPKLRNSLPYAERNTPQLVWLLHYGTNNRRIIWDAIFEVEKIATSGLLNKAHQLKDQCNQKITRFWTVPYWATFERNSAPVYAFLEKLMGTPKNEDNPLGFNYSSDAPINPISGESISPPRQQQSSPSKLGIPNIPDHIQDPELAALEDRAERLVKSVVQYPLNTSKLTVSLRGYQEFSAKYILHQRQVLLGDEMGLGKTIEAIAALAHLSASGESHFMVICPLSVIINWSREIEQHSTLPKWIIHGQDSLSSYYLWRKYGGVAITTYDTIKKLQPPGNQFISMLVVDEAHYIKNPKSARTHALLAFKKSAVRTLFMTGTPLENKIKEMVFLIRCLRSDIADLVDCNDDKPDALRFRLKIAPVYLRRVREDVLPELPDKEEIEDWCTMTEYEKAEYQHSLVSDSYMTLRRLSWNIHDISYSSKAKRMIEICDDALVNNRKVIVFSYFRDTLIVAQKVLGRRCFGPINGSISITERQRIVDDFSSGPQGSVLLCQVQAGGVGLNIQAANVIIFCEPQWKPSTENQAISRSYRMGQTHKVFVHRLLMENTIDEYILAILQGKTKDFELFANMSEAGMASMTELQMMNDIVNYEAKRYGITRIASS